MQKILLICIGLYFHLSFTQSLKVPLDTVVITKHKTVIKGVAMNYTAETGMQPVWDDDGVVIASLFYTYYSRDNVKNRNQRPVIISFNGGPGSASVWMHMAYTGPRILKVDGEGYPVQPYGYKSNPYSILDVADIVFVNPVNTAYSRRVANKEGCLLYTSPSPRDLG